MSKFGRPRGKVALVLPSPLIDQGFVLLINMDDCIVSLWDECRIKKRRAER